MRILLTGAEGFTGRHFSIAASKAGYEVFALKADLTNSEALSAEVKMVSPAYVLHLAAISAVTHADEEAFYRVNVIGTQNLLRALSKLDYLPRKSYWQVVPMFMVIVWKVPLQKRFIQVL